jgi:hypothetical protein
MEYS